MKITDVLVHRVNVPLQAPYRWAAGVYEGVSKGIIEVLTDEGVVGLGELPNAELCDLVESHHRPRLVGADPFNLDECSRRCVPETAALRATHDQGPLRAFAGIEIALWDIKGKALGVPVHTLLGGACRYEIAFSEYFAFRLPSGDVAGENDPVDVARYCARMREEHGSTVFEGKVAVFELATEIELVREVRAAIGSDAVLRLDANQGWSLPTARRALAALEPYDIANIEDPVGGLREMAKLRQHTPISISTHETDLGLAVEQGVPDAFVLNLAALGGILETVKFIAACEALGFGFWFYSGDAGVATAAYLQVSAALPYLEQPHQSLLRWYTDDVIAGGAFRPEKGVVSIPSGPGLGVELDPDGLSRCKERYMREGPVNQLGVPGELAYPRRPRQ